MPIDASADADEAFLTSTVREVQTITHVDGDALPDAPGPITTRLAKDFRPSSTATSTRSSPRTSGAPDQLCTGCRRRLAGYAGAPARCEGGRRRRR